MQAREAALAQAEPPPIVITKMATYTDGVRWESCVDFKNASTRTVQAIRFLFTYYDAFDEPIQTFTADRVGEFAPGVAIEGASPESALGANNCWQILGRVPSLSRVSVETVKIRFGDSQVWAPPEPRTKFFIATLGRIDFDHPKTIVCNAGIAKLRYSWAYAHEVPICGPAIAEWERTHTFSPVNGDSSTSPQSPAP